MITSNETSTAYASGLWGTEKDTTSFWWCSWPKFIIWIYSWGNIREIQIEYWPVLFKCVMVRKYQKTKELSQVKGDQRDVTTRRYMGSWIRSWSRSFSLCLLYSLLALWLSALWNISVYWKGNKPSLFIINIIIIVDARHRFQDKIKC